MGFEVPETVAKLVFTDPSFDGLEVVCALIPLDELVAAAPLAKINTSNVTPEDLGRVQQLRDAFAGALRSWNLTRGGQPIPADLAGVKSLELLFVLQLIEPWVENCVAAAAKQQAKHAEEQARVAAALPTLPVETLPAPLL